MKFDFEGLNISIDPSGKFVIDSIFDKDGNKLQLEDIKYDKGGNVIVPNENEGATVNDK